ncbi:hypothetical protein PFICI_12453 [Pestalotiopsis fici W106-1]|uniref:ADF-H domain-containing protein n=1 Tax=Pestalotiopsis fici (strain W106-1 / CGMCC3.15140) TaxID=1229662 RepID=W3WNY6_PESFW|nr:uncharacterized protein PFICI_12453 [Pestalotiopsis fici W106-1]ETS75509.1 hypothetical protein PFICI_12453 [Pestalotiopsis fici W106-1]
MSLNGLDAATVKEAYEAAVAEAGGWFLLKYASRDEIEVHCQGKNGIVEMRNAIAEYEEPSPLYGFLKYRRRNVILKYQPDDCSRLIQARATVHFNAVCERFTPYSTMFEITEAKELKDTKLSAACSLHAASGSCSSSTSSLRRRRLMEITEEEEEEERERKRQSVVEEEDRPTTPRSNAALSPFSSPEPPVVLDREQIEASKEPNFASTSEEPNFEGVRPMSPGEGRLSSQSARPDFYNYSSYPYGKPKVKLGPRPSLETNKNPHTASNFRPVAALPAGFKLASKGSRRGRSGSQDHTAEDEDHEVEQEVSDLAALNASTTILEVPAESEAELLAPRPNTSSGASMKSVTSTAPVKESKITPEKARLMKAMKMRQEKKKLSLLIADTASITAPEAVEGKAELQALEEELSSANIESDITADLPTPMTMTTEATEDTFTDSHPPSPTIASSEIGESTKASSVSESTDETVQASKDESTLSEEDKLPAEDDEFNDKSDIRTQDIDVPSNKDDIASPTSPKSPYGIPVSRFASNDGKSPTTPSLKSKFSTQDLRSPVEQPIPAPPTVVTPPAITTTEEVLEPESQVLPKRRATVAPIRTTHSRNNSEGTFHDVVPDDDLLDALQSATFEEAQPMSVSKSPITPVFPSSSPKRPQTVAGTRVTPTRTFSQPMRGPLLAPSDVSSSSARSVSAGGAALLHSVTRQPSSAALSTKKPTSSSIAQRIKALEQLSGKKAGAEDSQSRVATASNLVNTRKQGVRETSKSPVPSLSRASSRTRQPPHSPTADMGKSRDVSPAPDASAGPTTRGRSGSVASRLSKFEAGGQQMGGRPDTIQVTARIVRDGQNSIPKRPSSKDPAEYNTADLKQSPLFVDHLKAVPEPITTHHEDGTNLRTVEQPKETIQERRMSRDDRKASISEDERMQRRRSSLGIVKDFIKDRRSSNASKSSDNLAILSPAPSIKSSSRPPSVHQASGSSRGRRLSVSSRRSSFSKDRENATPVMSPSATTDHSSDDADKSSPTEKRSNSRTSRFMRRLSNTLTATRKTASPNTPTTVREEEEATSEGVFMARSDDAASALSSYMGDVNVQFPDNLLWKRRSLCLDTNGFLILNALNGTEKTGLKRYHLSDFRVPYIPDVDMQELPNSICLDFVAGSALQLACEDRQGQQHVLAALQEAHQKHMAFGQ